MKKSILLFAVALMCCNKTQKQTLINDDLSQYEQVGKLHNILLDKLYVLFKNGAINSHGSYKAALSRLLKTPIGVTSPNKSLSINVQVFQAKLYSLMVNEQVREYDNLLRQTLSNPGLTILDRKSMIGMVSVLKASSEYWTDANLKKWHDLTPGRTSMAKDVVKGAIFADCKGAVKGAVTGAIAGAAGGTVTLPIVGTVAGAAGVGLTGMIVGAVGASIEHVVTDWIKDWIGWSTGYSCPQGTTMPVEQGGEFGVFYFEEGTNPCPKTLEDSINWIASHPINVNDSTLFIYEQ